ncbi:MAG TPA: alpha/beta hydrolase [Opitutaceae bacterium]|nr:alpha/beta hydrolase [Opitutaceae bacterium]
MRIFFLAAILLPAVILRAAEPQVVPLWPNGAPGFESRRDEPEQARDYWVRNIHQPSLTVFLPPKEKATGAAVVVCPGGGHRELVFNSEGVEAARFLNSIGVAALVLKYRLGREAGSPYQVETHARADGQRAVRVARSRATEWGIDPKRIGMMGFSAGGEVLAMVVYQPTGGDAAAADPVDRVSCRPDFQISIYPGPGGAPKSVPADTPPAFFLAAIDDRGPADVITDMVPKFRAANVPVEVHLYARGGHAFNVGLRTKLVTLKGWPQRLADWMADNSILDPDPAHRAEK